MCNGPTISLQGGVLCAVYMCCVLPAAPQLFSAMGSTRQQALLTHVIIGVVNVVTTLVAVFTVDSIGRCA
jgi:hypothetical protein